MATCPGLDVLDGPRSAARGEALRHLHGCAACRELWLADDPSHVFALLGAAPVPAADLERLTVRLDAALGGDALAAPRAASGPAASRGGSRQATPMWQLRAAGLALAAALVLAAALGAYLGLREAPDPIRAALPGASAEKRSVAAEVHVMSPAAANVINLQAGDTQVVMIFDEALDL